MLKYLTFRELIRQRSRDRIVSLTFIIFCCSEFFEDIIRYVGLSATVSHVGISVILLFFLILNYGSLYYSTPHRKCRVWDVYAAAFGFILVSWLVHPEYSSWFTHQEYGILNRFLVLYRGFYALLFISFFKTAGQLLSSLAVATRINFFYYVIKYIRTQRQGYWIVYRMDGTLSHAMYSLDFGYNVMICVVLFLGLYIYRKKIYDLGMMVVSALLTLLSGSRGSIICLLIALLLYIVYRWDEMRSNGGKYLIFLLITVLAFVMVSIGFETILDFGISLLSRSNLSGRTVRMLTSGSAFSDSGRNRIWKQAFEMIRNGGLLGYGFYGDRYVIGQNIYYGYPHNIFLEIIIEFGIVIGASLCIKLLYDIIQMAVTCKDVTWRVLFTVFFSLNAKLFLSDSFWYYWAFWALLGVMRMWRKQARQARRKSIAMRRTIRVKRATKLMR